MAFAVHGASAITSASGHQAIPAGPFAGGDGAASNCRCCSPVSTDQIRITLASVQVPTRFPSELHVTVITGLSCCSWCEHVASEAFQILAVLSALLDANSFPSGDQFAALIVLE